MLTTGKLYDGAAGARAIKDNGGCVISQDYESSEAPDMPRAAIRTGAVDFVFPLERIAPAFISLVMVKGITEIFGGSMPLANFGA